MAGAMAGGGLPVRAGLALVPGGVGIAVSSVATVSDAKDTLRSKTAAQVIGETHAILLSLSVPPETIDRLDENRNFTPADLLIMARALKQLAAENTAAFVEHAAGAGSRNVAFYHRPSRPNIGGAQRRSRRDHFFRHSWWTADQHHRANGNVVAAFTFDDIAWTDIQARTFSAATAPDLPVSGRVRRQFLRPPVP